MKALVRLFVVVIFLIDSSAKGQVPNWVWARNMGGLSSDDAGKVVTDSAGNVFVTGQVSYAGMFGLDSSTLGSGMFLARYDRGGILIWVKYFGSGYSRDLAVNNNGDIYLLGQDKLIKCNMQGDTIWVERFLGTVQPFAIALNKNGDIGITGNFGYNFFNQSVSLPNLGSTDLFIAKYSSNKTLLWVKAAGGIGSDGAYGIAADSKNNFYVTGRIKGDAVFDNDTIFYNGSSTKTFIAKYDGLGNLGWAQTYVGTFGVALAISGDDFIFVTGDYPDTLHTARQPVKYNNESSFLSKLDTNGAVIWSNNVGGPSSGFLGNIALDSYDNSYVGSWFQDTIFFDNLTYIPNGNGVSNFVVKYGADGSVKYVKTTDSSGIIDGICVSADGDEIYATGYHGNKAHFGNTVLNTMNDLFIGKLSVNATAITPVAKIDDDISLFPTPTTGRVKTQFNYGQYNAVFIADQLGRAVFEKGIDPACNQIEIDLSTLPAGIYYAKFIGKHANASRKIIIQH